MAKLNNRAISLYRSANDACRNKMLTYIKECVGEFGGSIDTNLDGYYPTCSIDMERHDNFYHNAAIHRIYADENGDMKMKADDYPAYDINKVNTDELIDIAEFLDENIDELKDWNGVE